MHSTREDDEIRISILGPLAYRIVGVTFPVFVVGYCVGKNPVIRWAIELQISVKPQNYII
jgi:hypothetical protein